MSNFIKLTRLVRLRGSRTEEQELVTEPIDVNATLIRSVKPHNVMGPKHRTTITFQDGSTHNVTEIYSVVSKMVVSATRTESDLISELESSQEACQAKMDRVQAALNS